MHFPRDLTLFLVDSVNMPRKVVKDFTFSNGTVIPAGNTIVVAGYAMHHDEVSLSTFSRKHAEHDARCAQGKLP